MSSYNPDELRSPSDPLLPFSTRKEPFTTAQLRFDTMLQFGMLTKEIRIINADGANAVTYRTHSPSEGLSTVPPASDETITDWTSYIEINPNAVSGTGTLEIDLVPIEAAKKK